MWENCLFSPVSSFIQSFIYIMNLYTSGFNVILEFGAQVVPSLAIRSSFSWHLCPFDIGPSLWRLFLIFFLVRPFSHPQLIFPMPILESTTSLGSPGFFYWEWCQKPRSDSWVCAGCCWEAIDSGPPQLTEQGSAHVCTNLCTCAYLQLFPYVTVPICVKLNVSSYWGLRP